MPKTICFSPQGKEWKEGLGSVSGGGNITEMRKASKKKQDKTPHPSIVSLKETVASHLLPRTT